MGEDSPTLERETFEMAREGEEITRTALRREPEKLDLNSKVRFPKLRHSGRLVHRS